jgi:hypothetical protein
MVDGARGGGELKAALIALVEFAVGAGLARLLVRFALASDRRYTRGFAGEALHAIGPAHLFEERKTLGFGVQFFVNV